MKNVFKKYGKHLLSLAVVSTVLVLPMIVAAGTIEENMRTAAGNLATANSGPDALYQMIGLIINIVLGILGVLLVLIIIWAGFLWMTSAGKPDQVEKAKKMIYQAVIGLLIIFAAYAIASFVIYNLQSITGTTG